ncbi:MAG: hypothetical protein V4724_15055 [Pseudomonadota bacterium]
MPTATIYQFKSNTDHSYTANVGRAARALLNALITIQPSQNVAKPAVMAQRSKPTNLSLFEMATRKIEAGKPAAKQSGLTSAQRYMVARGWM